ncbi:MAG: thioester reductase domain-containing protein [Bacteroidales bacterium]
MNNTIYSLLQKQMSRHDDKILINQLKSEKWLSYKSDFLLDWVDRIHNQLLDFGINEGYRIGILMEASPEWIVTALSLWKSKTTAALLSTMVTPEENIAQIRLTDLSAILVTRKMYETYNGSFPNEIPIYILETDVVPVQEKGRPIKMVEPNIDDGNSEIAVMVLTSGTTGNTKVVLQNHQSLISQACNPVFLEHYRNSDPVFSVLPYFHIYPLVTNVIIPLYSGVSIIQIEDLSLDNIQKAFTDLKPRGMITTPRLLEAVYVKIKLQLSKMSNRKLRLTCDLLRLSYWVHTKLRIRWFGKLLFWPVYKVFGGRMCNITCGGAPLDPFLMQFYESCGLEIHVGFGLSETTGPVTYSARNNRKPASVGSGIPGVEVGIHEPDDQGIGEIKIKGDMIMDEYFRDPENTKEALRNNFFYTGDVGYLDKKGNVFLTGRKKELIVSSTGKKTAPAEIESVFQSLPFIEEYVALGVKSSDNRGDEAYLAIVLEDKSEGISSEDKKKKIREEISLRNQKLPHRLRVRHVYFTDSLPKTNLLKVKRRALADEIILDKQRNTGGVKENNSVKLDTVSKDIIDILQHISEHFLPKVSEEMHLDEFGMDSLMALQFYNLLRKKYKERIVADWIYANPTIGELAEAMKTGKADFFRPEVKGEKEVLWYKNYRWKRLVEKEEDGLKNMSISKILLTGATGVVGGKLLFDLLAKTSSEIYCLLRNKKDIKALDRLLNILELYNGGGEIPVEWQNRIKVIEGDLNKTLLGLDKKTYVDLSNQIEAVVHCAAKVSLHGIYDEVAANNVGGTDKIIDFTLSTQDKFLLFVSSYSIFGDAPVKNNIPFTEYDMDVGQRFTNMGYQQSKFESEILVRAAKSRGLKWTIIRLGDVYGDSKTGLYPIGLTSVGGIYYEMLKMLFETRMAADINRFFDITPVDYVSRGILHFIFEHRPVFGTFHLKNPQVLKFSDVVDALKMMGLPIDVIPVHDYKKMILEDNFIVNGEVYDSPALRLMKFRPDEFLQETKTWVDSRRTAEILAKYDILCASPDLELLKTYFEYCSSIGFIKIM